MSLRISVITATFNCAGTVGEALSSVHAQTWPGVEHIVIDGASSDGTLEVIERHRPGIAKLVSEPDLGIYDALNKGIRQASGDVVGFMHADDTFASRETLEHVASAFEDPSVGAVYGDLIYVSKSDSSQVVRYWRAGPYRRSRLANGWMPPHPTFYVRREHYARYGMFDTRYAIAADYENMLRLLWRDFIHAAYVPEVLVRMRMGGMSNRSLLSLAQKSREDFAALRQHGLGGLQGVFLKNVTKLPQFVIREATARCAIPRNAA
jgi:glycosyltransferase involved in cell wall biosynthesis